MAKDYVDSEEACAILKIKPQSLYAYVSRGLVRTVDAPGRASLYARADLDVLRARSQARKGHGAVAASALRWGEPVLESAITRLDEHDIYYRGFPLSQLISNNVSFERVAELMWSGMLPPVEPTWETSETKKRRHDSEYSVPVTYAELCASLSQLNFSPAAVDDQTLSETLAVGRVVLSSCADRSGDQMSCAASLVQRLLPKGRRPDAAELLNAALVASADFELSASTFAARIAASTGASLLACLQAGLAAFSGPAHGAQISSIEEMLLHLEHGTSIDSYVKRALAPGGNLPGFGQKLFPKGDPRAVALFELIQPPPNASMKAIDELARAVFKRTGLKPNLELALVILTRRLDLPRGSAFGLFATGRIAGWIAHVVEQRQQGHVLRPRAKYTGR